MVETDKLLTVSVVSHGQSDLVRPLLNQLATVSRNISLQVVLTENLSERQRVQEDIQGIDIRYIVNTVPKGFGANHNAAFACCDTPYFCVINPDVRLIENPFPILLDQLQKLPGVAAPRVVAEDGEIEDSARRVPRIVTLLSRAFARLRGRRLPPDYHSEESIPVDWAAGMFLLFDADVFRTLKGFDDRYHLYCEDVDVCVRTWLQGRSVSWVNKAVVQHDARRDSHRQLQYLRWHVASMARLLTSRPYWQFRMKKAVLNSN